MSEPRGGRAVSPAPTEPGSPRGKRRAAPRTGRRPLLGAIALAATLGAGLLFGAQRPGRHAVSVPEAAASAPRDSTGPDPELQVAPAPPGAPQQIVQALSGRAGSAQVAPSPAASMPDAVASTTAAADGAPPAQDASPADAAAMDAGDAQPPAADGAGLVSAGSPPAAPADAASALADPGRAYAGAAPLPRPPAQVSTAAAIVWPARGPLTSLFGPQHPLGIDIGIPLGTIVRAIADGRVAFAGGDACCSYGYYVDIDHGDGITTRYGHLLYVPALAAGQPVHAGDPIGLSGTTGNSTGPHLHFEIRLNGLPVNPLLVLPR